MFNPLNHDDNLPPLLYIVQGCIQYSLITKILSNYISS